MVIAKSSREKSKVSAPKLPSRSVGEKKKKVWRQAKTKLTFVQSHECEVACAVAEPPYRRGGVRAGELSHRGEGVCWVCAAGAPNRLEAIVARDMILRASAASVTVLFSLSDDDPGVVSDEVSCSRSRADSRSS